MKINQAVRVSNVIISREICCKFIGLLFAIAIVFSSEFTAFAQPVAGNTGDACTELSFQQTDFFDVGSYDVDFVETVDVNNDGISDVLVNLLNLGQISVQLGDGRGGLLPANVFNTGGFPSDFEIADVNRDGELDILAVNETSNQIAILIGDGNGNFSLSQSINLGFSPKLIEVGNFNSDQYLDFVVAGGFRLDVYSGSRSLAFTQVSTTQSPQGTRSLVATDLNGDQITDLVSRTFDGTLFGIRTYLGQTNGSLIESSAINNTRTDTIDAGDVNNDNNGDFVAVERFGSVYTISTYLGNGNGTFQNPINSVAPYLIGLQLFDINLDGKLDAVTNLGAVLLGDETGAFALFQNAFSSNSAENVGFGDFDSDDFPDIAFVNGRRTGLYLNKGDGSFRNVNEFGSNEFQINRPFATETADFNMDGKDDFVVVTAGDNRAYIYIQAENGRFIPTPENGIQVGGGFNVSAFSVTVADFNNDQIPDIVVPDSFARQIVVFTGNGDATFSISRFNNSDQFSYTPRFVRTGKFNNDNFTDIIVTNTSGSYIVYLNDGMGGFTRLTPTTIGSSTNLRLVAIGDITNDGILDLVTGRPDLGSLTFLTGNGDGTFVASIFPINGVAALSGIILEDLNDDGNLDLILGGDRILVSFGVGNGGFFNPVLYSFEGNVNDLELFDFDGDGIKDIVAAKSNTGSSTAIYILKGTGNGQYEQAFALGEFSSSLEITPGDFNGDGKPDLATVSGIYVVRVLFNDTNSLPCVSAGNAQVNEQPGGSTLTFDVSLSRPSTEAISVGYKAVGRSSEKVADFVPVTGTVDFPVGSTVQTVTVNVNDDQLDENDETLILKLTNASNAKILDAVGVGTIIDNDNPPTLLVPSFVGVVEGSGPSSIGFGIIVQLSEPSGRKVRVRAASQDVTAVSGKDYDAFSDFMYYAPGNVSRIIELIPVPDYRVEPDEVFNVNFTDPLNTVLSNNVLPVAIINDDVGGEVQFALSNVSISESGKIAEMIITRAGGNASDVAVEYNTLNGTAIGGIDFQITAGRVTFDANETSKTIFVPIIDDLLNEDTETFSLSLQNISGGGTLGPRTSLTVSIVDNDPLPRLSVSDRSVTEGNTGSNVINYAVNLLEPSGRNVSVNYATLDGTALSPKDYLAASGSVNFAPGESSKNIQLTIIGDRQVEPDEAFNLILSSAGNADIFRGNASIVILNDDLTNYSTPFDFDGDGKTDVSIFRPAPAEWWYRRSSDGGNGALQFGQPSEKPVPADFTGDHVTDIAFWRMSSGEWFILRSEDFSFYSVPFGTTGDIPAPGDFDGDGFDDLAVFRPSTSTWYISNSSGGTRIVGFGTSEDKPVVADYDGDGKDDIAIYRPSVSEWWVNRSLGGTFAVQFGSAGDRTVQGDYTGDGKADIAFFRPSTGFWFILRSEDGTFYSFPFGTNGDIPSPGDYDGDGRFDTAVFRQSNGTWYINGSQSGVQIIGFGSATDIPLPGVYGVE